MKTGLVLEGGGMRGLFTAGVLDVLLENNISVDAVIGVSAGACFGCNYVSKQIGRSLRYNLDYCRDSRYMGISTFLRTGDYVAAHFAYHVLPIELDIFDIPTFEANPTEFHLVATDAHTGKPIYYHMDKVNYDSLEWMRASASMPLVSTPVSIDGYELLDGGITDSIPLQYFQSIGFNKNLVILTQPRDFRKSRTALLPLFKLFMRRYPKIIERMACRHEMYNSQLDYIHTQEQLGNTLILCPELPLNISRVSKDRVKMREVYEQGRILCNNRIDEIKRFLSK